MPADPPAATTPEAHPPPGPEPERQPADPPASPPTRGRRLGTRLALLAFGLLAAYYVRTQGPREQHVRVVLGSAAPQVTGVGLQYVGQDGDPVLETRFDWPPGQAPRVVAHEPKLSDGAYRLQIDLDAQGGRRAVQRQVTLGGGSTQVDVSSVLLNADTK